MAAEKPPHRGKSNLDKLIGHCFKDPEAAQRLALLVLEAADVAPQADLARAVSLNQDRSVRVYKQRLRQEGLAGLFDRPIPG